MSSCEVPYWYIYSHYTECRYAECHNAECHIGIFTVVILSVGMLNVKMRSAMVPHYHPSLILFVTLSITVSSTFVLTIVMLSVRCFIGVFTVVTLSVGMLNVIMRSAMVPHYHPSLILFVTLSITGSSGFMLTIVMLSVTCFIGIFTVVIMSDVMLNVIMQSAMVPHYTLVPSSNL
jgi:hypothetical protein